MQKMILILSSPTDFSTDNVIDWLEKLHCQYLRIHPEQFFKSPFNIKIPFQANNRLLTADGYYVNINKIKIIWHRKWSLKEIMPTNIFSNPKIEDEIFTTREIEFNALSDYLFGLLKDIEWIDSPSAVKRTKISQLNIAKEVGLAVPETIITTSKKELQAFSNKHASIITKPIERGLIWGDGKVNFQSYSARIAQQDIDNLPESFFPSLFQEEIKKQFDLRVFYLVEEIYSMAIFSQRDEQTAVDFRRYNFTNPNRTIPFSLPTELRERILCLMKKMDIKTGSLDFIKTVSGKYVFLEVNPCGQYEMTSFPCNYNLDKKIAKYLIDKDYEKGVLQ